MAKIIEFYIPINFRWKAKWIPPQDRGKIIEFSLQTKKSVTDPDSFVRHGRVVELLPHHATSLTYLELVGDKSSLTLIETLGGFLGS